MCETHIRNKATQKPGSIFKKVLNDLQAKGIFKRIQFVIM